MWCDWLDQTLRIFHEFDTPEYEGSFQKLQDNEMEEDLLALKIIEIKKNSNSLIKNSTYNSTTPIVRTTRSITWSSTTSTLVWIWWTTVWSGISVTIGIFMIIIICFRNSIISRRRRIRSFSTHLYCYKIPKNWRKKSVFYFIFGAQRFTYELFEENFSNE